LTQFIKRFGAVFSSIPVGISSIPDDFVTKKENYPSIEGQRSFLNL